MSSTDRITGADVVAWIRLAADVFRGEKEHLTALDSAIGDADHGINMDRGFQAVLAKLPTFPQDDVGAILKGVGMTLMSTVGGASGPLYGSFFLQLGNATVGKADISVEDFAAALDNARRPASRASARPSPATRRCSRRSSPPRPRSTGPPTRARARPRRSGPGPRRPRRACVATIPLVARKGRASYLGERSAGHQDPGATSTHLLLKAAADAWSRA